MPRRRPDVNLRLMLSENERLSFIHLPNTPTANRSRDQKSCRCPPVSIEEFQPKRRGNGMKDKLTMGSGWKNHQRLQKE